MAVTDKTSPDVGLHYHGPKNYCMYTKPVGEIFKWHTIKYADDTQVYMTLKPCDKWDDISPSIEACITLLQI